MRKPSVPLAQVLNLLLTLLYKLFTSFSPRASRSRSLKVVLVLVLVLVVVLVLETLYKMFPFSLIGVSRSLMAHIKCS